jgi:hypothetical protein
MKYLRQYTCFDVEAMFVCMSTATRSTYTVRLNAIPVRVLTLLYVLVDLIAPQLMIQDYVGELSASQHMHLPCGKGSTAFTLCFSVTSLLCIRHSE